ncbi:hypothetical protein QBC41DRAFT_313918 [Cercophora samala]|uniref:Uncharacterized protein n=1 Tax=Cercophora samala TaxID=330535 RepID=A0AA39ZK07_9PEZI|nr:hypothetical protein QBC41DRAFT_313918 [Cercophora samala]
MRFLTVLPCPRVGILVMLFGLLAQGGFSSRRLWEFPATSCCFGFSWLVVICTVLYPCFVCSVYLRRCLLTPGLLGRAI